ncbi:MAG: 2-oxoacid:acceptor oxidoreductase family protein [Deltaproteobacteria bacterium]|nr:2-oxoacid:acceptor oxidoreductase family protein [Deltaproteobacteria bacterium]
MNETIHQQIVISGLGGQGVLFVTRLLAEAAIDAGFPVLTSETHGMAQRGGTVVSHLKVGPYASPLIRPGQADGLICLKAENIAAHGPFLRPGGWTVVNSDADGSGRLDADRIACELGDARAVNLVVLGFVLAALGETGKPLLFCSPAGVEQVLERRLAQREPALKRSLAALAAGAAAARAEI